MKKVIALTCFLFFTAAIFAQTNPGDTTIAKKGLCRTLKRKGVEVYILTEPVREYTVTGEVTDDDVESVMGALFGEEKKHTLTQSIDILVQNATRKAGKKKFQFDAIITEDGSTGTCIKFN